MDKIAAEVLLESHQSEMEEKLSGRKDPETLELYRNIEGITKSNEASKAAFIGELEERFDTQKDNWWDEVRRGSNRKSKWLAMSICKLFAYYDLFFSEADLSLIFGVRGDNHNTKLAIEKLIDVRILKKTTDNKDSEVYVFVDMLQMHLRYETDAKVEESIEKDLKRLYREGNAIINARQKRKRDGNNSDAQNSDNKEKEEEDEEEDQTTFVVQLTPFLSVNFGYFCTNVFRTIDQLLA